MRPSSICLTFVFCLLAKPCIGGEQVGFNRDIRPILSAKCFQCHGADAAAREGELRLDLPDTSDGPFAKRDTMPAITPGDLANSGTWQRVTTDDPSERMPPLDSHKDPLSAAERDLLQRWITEGAGYENFWAFVPPKPQIAPTVSRADWNQNRIDRFVMAKLDSAGLQPQRQADRRSLIRRVTLDLTGLPPTLKEINQFLADDAPEAYENLVEQLLARPQYGEHMAKYWLDVVRFADTNGIHHDHYREMSPYRDWVIRAFNDNQPYDQFVIDQIAGDLHATPTLDQQIASGFNRLHLVIDKGTAIPEESFTRNVVDSVSAVGTAFMGMTLGCAVCHDHKYDPVTQRDFYQLFAFFNNIDSEPETPGRDIHAPFVRLPTAAQREQLSSIDLQIAAATEDLRSLRTTREQEVAQQEIAAKTTESEAIPSELEKAAEEKLRELQQAKSELEATIPVSLVMKEREEVRPAHILVRGAYDHPGELVERNTPSFLPPMKSEGVVKTRMDLARWLTDADHPLTARVAVNRIWQQFFGVGLVKTSEDFGTQGEWPSHPELLDDLTIRFVNSGWDVKAMVELIVTSQTYRQASQADKAAYQRDPQNRLLARGPRFRMDAEMIRDQILAVSGLLDETMYGKSVKPPQPPNLWKSVSMVSSSTYAFEADTGAKIHRRSLYSFWKRAMPPPQMTIFDAPTREACTARRERTNTPLQALVLMNEAQYFQAARHFAQRLLHDPQFRDAPPHDPQHLDAQRIALAYESVTSHLPNEAQAATLLRGLNSLREAYRQDPSLARQMVPALVEGNLEYDAIELAAHTMLINALFNLDEAKTRE